MHSLSWTETLFHVHFKGTSQLCLIDFPHIARILQLVQLHVLEVILFLEVFVKSVHHLDAAVEELDAMALLINVELVELVAMLVCVPLRVKELQQLVAA